jgi:hypothetical protein
MFSDPCFVLLVPIMLLVNIAVARICLVMANLVGLWDIPDKGTGWHSSMGDGANDKYGVPDPADIEMLKRIADAASTDNYIMNQKITQDTFRYKFMDHNRLWLVEKLPTVFTPRTLRRSRCRPSCRPTASPATKDRGRRGDSRSTDWGSTPPTRPATAAGPG